MSTTTPPSLSARLDALSVRLDLTLSRDRPGLVRALARLRARARAGTPSGKPVRRGDARKVQAEGGVQDELEALDERIAHSIRARQARAARVPALHFPEALPVSARREEIARAIGAHPVVIVCGETGSGKTTQLPKICLSLGRGTAGLIGHTQPRRIAARSVATRIAEELHSPLGELVGYKVRFHDHTRSESAIKLMTDGILLAEIQRDRLLRQYDTLIIDEAHERSLNIDFLLGYLKQLLPRRPDLKLIITSATIDPQRFAAHFGQAPIIEVSGRAYPVEVLYRADAVPDVEGADGGARGRGERDQTRAILAAVDELAALDRRHHRGPGDILVFLASEREIRETAEALRKHHPSHTEILPLFSRLSAAEQQRVFQAHSGRRIVLATNVAETSLTVPGIRYVIDPGYARISRYSVRSQVQRLPIEKVSQASADQRKGRCGRVSAGVCIRLYSEADFLAREPHTPPEIQRTHLAGVILQMQALGLGQVERFPFIDPPEPRAINDGYRLLHELGAVEQGGGRAQHLTPLGQQLARLSVDVRFGRMLLAAGQAGCLSEVLVIVAALAVQDPRERPLEAQAAADEAHRAYLDPRSDFLTLLALWRACQDRKRHLSGNKFRQWCRRTYLSWLRVREWEDIHRQLLTQVRELGLQANTEPAGYDAIHRALLSGLLGHVATRADPAHDDPAQEKGTGEGARETPRGARRRREAVSYRGPRNRSVSLHPGSGLTSKPPKWIMAAELVETQRLYARGVAEIAPEWVEALGAHLLKRSYSNPRFSRKAGRVIADEQTTLYGLVITPRRPVNYGPLFPREARELFIRDGLVRGGLRSRAACLQHNQGLIAEIETLEHKSRRRDILIDEDSLFAFYDARLPEALSDGRHFERWLKHAQRDAPRVLYLTREDVLHTPETGVGERDFPDHLLVGGLRLTLTYCFEPGRDEDGVTVHLPLAALNQIDPAAFAWLVPGLLCEKLTALIRALPKPLRRNFVPAPDFAEACLSGLEEDAAGEGQKGGLLVAFAARLQRMTGIAVPLEAWNEAALPVHLRMRFEVVDVHGGVLDSGRDLPALQARLAGRARDHFEAMPETGLERSGLTRWDFGPLPEVISQSHAGVVVQAYPALIDEGDSVALRLMDQAERAAARSRAGVRRLYMLALADKVRYLRKQLPGLNTLCLHYAPVGSCEALKDELVAAVFDAVFLAEALPRDADAFEAHLAAQRGDLIEAGNALAAELGATLAAYHDVARRLRGSVPPQWLAVLSEIRAQLDALVYPGFVTATPAAWRCHLPRFIKAIGVRLERLEQQPARDREQARVMAPLWARYRQRVESGRPLSADWVQFRWLLEELHVSLFAQQLKTSQAVSVKRLTALLTQLD